MCFLRLESMQARQNQHIDGILVDNQGYINGQLCATHRNEEIVRR